MFRRILRSVPFVILACTLLSGCDYVPQTSSQRLQEELARLAAAKDEPERFYMLGRVAKESFNADKFDDAERYANEALDLAPRYEHNWNYGNAIQDGNIVLGRLALRAGRVEAAKKFLAQAGKSPGSPQMNSFGPNMSLADDLLAKGETQAVLDYFAACRKFWQQPNALDAWTADVTAGRRPNFGPNLIY